MHRVFGVDVKALFQKRVDWGLFTTANGIQKALVFSCLGVFEGLNDALGVLL